MPQIKNTARSTVRETRGHCGRQRKKGRNLKGNMKNTFVLKNIKNALNRTESEHENRERGKAENELKYIYETVREKNVVLKNLASKYNLRIKLKNKRVPK